MRWNDHTHYALDALRLPRDDYQDGDENWLFRYCDVIN